MIHRMLLCREGTLKTSLFSRLEAFSRKRMEGLITVFHKSGLHIGRAPRNPDEQFFSFYYLTLICFSFLKKTHSLF